MFQYFDLMKVNLVWGIWNLYGDLLKERKLFIVAWILKIWKVPYTYNKDKEQINDEGITEIEHSGKDLNKAREVYFDLIKMQKMAHTKYSVKKKVVQEGKQPPVIQKAVTEDMSASGEEKKKILAGHSCFVGDLQKNYLIPYQEATICEVG